MPVGRAAKDGGAEDAAGATSMPSLHPLTRMVSHPNKPDKAANIPVIAGGRFGSWIAAHGSFSVRRCEVFAG